MVGGALFQISAPISSQKPYTLKPYTLPALHPEALHPEALHPEALHPEALHPEALHPACPAYPALPCPKPCLPCPALNPACPACPNPACLACPGLHSPQTPDGKHMLLLDVAKMTWSPRTNVSAAAVSGGRRLRWTYPEAGGHLQALDDEQQPQQQPAGLADPRGSEVSAHGWHGGR